MEEYPKLSPEGEFKIINILLTIRSSIRQLCIEFGTNVHDAIYHVLAELTLKLGSLNAQTLNDWHKALAHEEANYTLLLQLGAKKAAEFRRRLNDLIENVVKNFSGEQVVLPAG